MLALWITVIHFFVLQSAHGVWKWIHVGWCINKSINNKVQCCFYWNKKLLALSVLRAAAFTCFHILVLRVLVHKEKLKLNWVLSKCSDQEKAKIKWTSNQISSNRYNLKTVLRQTGLTWWKRTCLQKPSLLVWRLLLHCLHAQVFAGKC